MKTVIFTDLHEDFDWVDIVLEGLSYDQVILNGDFYDEHGLGASHSEKTAHWLKSKFDDSRYHFNLGNHDSYYVFPTNKNLSCSGYTRSKKDAIHKVLDPSFGSKGYHSDLSPNIVRKFKLAHYVEGWFISHAGINPIYIPLKYSHLQGEELANKLLQMCDDALEQVIYKQYSPLMCDVSTGRGGHSDYGGILWQDWNEFEPITNFNQIVGHSQGKELRAKYGENSVNYCIDISKSTGKRGYAIIEDGKFSFHYYEMKENKV